MTEQDRIVLSALVSLTHLGDFDECCWSFAAIARQAVDVLDEALPATRPPPLDRKAVRVSCRRLARNGLAAYERGLWNDEGPAGSGYRATRKGIEVLTNLDAKAGRT